jgi:hypothetical protein
VVEDLNRSSIAVEKKGGGFKQEFHGSTEERWWRI